MISQVVRGFRAAPWRAIRELVMLLLSLSACAPVAEIELMKSGLFSVLQAFRVHAAFVAAIAEAAGQARRLSAWQMNPIRPDGCSSREPARLRAARW